MTKTLSAIAVALMLTTPAFAEGTLSNDGLPEQPVAVGQINYTASHGHWAKQEVAPAAQSASGTVASAQQTASVNDLLANHDQLYGRQ
jgi:hypothetical protein